MIFRFIDGIGCNYISGWPLSGHLMNCIGSHIPLLLVPAMSMCMRSE